MKKAKRSPTKGKRTPRVTCIKPDPSLEKLWDTPSKRAQKKAEEVFTPPPLPVDEALEAKNKWIKSEDSVMAESIVRLKSATNNDQEALLATRPIPECILDKPQVWGVWKDAWRHRYQLLGNKLLSPVFDHELAEVYKDEKTRRIASELFFSNLTGSEPPDLSNLGTPTYGLFHTPLRGIWNKTPSDAFWARSEIQNLCGYPLEILKFLYRTGPAVYTFHQLVQKVKLIKSALPPEEAQEACLMDALDFLHKGKFIVRVPTHFTAEPYVYHFNWKKYNVKYGRKVAPKRASKGKKS